MLNQTQTYEKEAAEEMANEKKIAEAKKTKKSINNLIKVQQNKIKDLEAEFILYDSASINEETKISAKKQCQEKIQIEKAELNELENALEELDNSKASLEEQNISNALAILKEKWLDVDDSLAFIIDEQKFNYITDYSTTSKKLNVNMIQRDMQKFTDEIAKKFGIKPWHLPGPRIKDLFNQNKRTYSFTRHSISPDNWKQSEVYLPINIMTKYFIDKHPVSEIDDDIIQYFDILMYSLSGGKKENQDHIEQWLLHKVLNFDKATTTPDLIIVGHVGGNGKGIIQAIARMMFPSSLTGKATGKTLTGHFNAILVGKLIVFFDDQDSREIPLEVVKQLAGSDQMIVEFKGKDQYEAEKTHSSAWFSNELPFRLTPSGAEGGVDRRFSVMRTNITFLESIRKFLSPEQPMTVEDSKMAAEEIVTNILLDRNNIAQWFKHLKKKHEKVNKHFTLPPLHGEDYKYFLKQQENSMDVIWKDLVLPNLLAKRVVPKFVISEMLRKMDQPYSASKITKMITKLATTNKIKIKQANGNVNIIPSDLGVAKRCDYFRLEDEKYDDFSFDWSQISKKKYASVGKGEELIKDDDWVFGSDDQDGLFEEAEDSDDDFGYTDDSTEESEANFATEPIVIPKPVQAKSIHQILKQLH
jgi:hypothetical protein